MKESCVTKTCSDCKELLQKHMFGKCKANKNDMQSRCKSCDLIKVTKYRKTKKGLITTILGGQKQRSKRRGHDLPNYTKEELTHWLLSQGKFNLLFNAWVNSGYLSLLKPSCDRLNDYSPYTLDNIRVVTWGENNEKGHADAKSGANNKQGKRVTQMTEDSLFVAEYHSASHAGRITLIQKSSITGCCTGRLKIAGGYRWKYAS